MRVVMLVTKEGDARAGAPRREVGSVWEVSPEDGEALVAAGDASTDLTAPPKQGPVSGPSDDEPEPAWEVRADPAPSFPATHDEA